MRVAGSSAVAVRVLAALLGIFFLFMGVSKTGWLVSDVSLVQELEGWLGSAPPISRWYLERVALPGAPLFARLVLFGELGAGIAMLLGIRTRLAALLALLMVLNFHFASGILFRPEYWTNGYGPPVIGVLLAIVIGGSRLPFSLSS